jgi:hypothetical protein
VAVLFPSPLEGEGQEGGLKKEHPLPLALLATSPSRGEVNVQRNSAQQS